MDIELYFEEKGSGKPLILLHGNNDSCGYFKGQIEAFSREYRVIAVDTRGHGKSPRGKAPFTIRQFADDLRDFMELHNIDRADILGFSDGGNIALVFALNYPEQVDRLILNGANLWFDGLEADVQKEISDAYKAACDRLERDGSAAAEAEMLRIMIDDPNVPATELSKISARTLVICGTHDMIKAEHSRLIADGIANSELCFIEGDHFIAEACPDEFNKAVLDFLSK